MTDEEFEQGLQSISNLVSPLLIEKLRGRDAIQTQIAASERDSFRKIVLFQAENCERLTEDLARVEAERDEALEFMRINARSGMSYAEQRDDAQAQLAQAVGLIRRSLGYEKLGKLSDDMEAFLARHAQAEQQEARVSKEQWQALAEAEQKLDAVAASREERAKRLGLAQGAQTVDGLDAVAEAIFNADKDNWYSAGPYPQLHANDKARLRAMARAALATQPAAIKLPPAPYVGPEAGYEFSSYEQGELQGRCDMWELIRKMNTPPASAHGDEAVLWGLLDESVNGSDEQQVMARAKIRHLVAMRAQAGEGGDV